MNTLQRKPYNYFKVGNNFLNIYISKNGYIKELKILDISSERFWRGILFVSLFEYFSVDLNKYFNFLLE
jgi:hypothetical protein